jgi:hypothetical protein
VVKVYAVVLGVGVVLLLAWIFATYLGGNVTEWKRIDPEQRLGKPGRRLISALVGFGLAGMSAEFSPFDLSWPVALALAIVGAAALAWYAGWVDHPRSETASPDVIAPDGPSIARTGTDQS